MNQPMPPLLVFADDWGRHPSSCQYLIRELLPTTMVTWVNTIGTRPPRFNLATLKRGLGKIRQWTRKPTEPGATHPHLQVMNPRMWPGFSTAWQRRLNCSLLSRQLLPVLQQGKTSPIAITTIPIVSDVMKRLPVHSWVYYCVDDFSTWPGLDEQTLGSMERQMLPQTDGIIAASEHLQQRLQDLGFRSDLLTHGVDLEFWRRSSAPQSSTSWDSFERPLVVFWGVIDKRMDLEFVSQLSSSLTRGTIVLAGPEDEPYEEITYLTRVKKLGILPLESLPSLAEAASVLIMPYADLPVTQAMQPLKLKEYLATGKPAVVRNLPANRVWNDCLDLVDDAQSFVNCVQARLVSGLPDDQARARARLAEESWSKKAEHFARLLTGYQKGHASQV